MMVGTLLALKGFAAAILWRYGKSPGAVAGRILMTAGVLRAG